MRIALLMVGRNLHGRIMLNAMCQAGWPPGLVVDEIGTDRAARLTNWLADQADNAPPLDELLVQSGATYAAVPDFHGAESRMALSAAGGFDYVVNGGCGLLKPDFLALPRRGFLNAHPGLLPEFRGVDPVLWSVAREAPVGATLHFMSEGIDEGPIVIREEAPTQSADSLTALRVECMRHGAALLARFLCDPDAFQPYAQDQARAEYFGAFPAENLPEAEAKLRCRAAGGANHRESLEGTES